MARLILLVVLFVLGLMAVLRVGVEIAVLVFTGDAAPLLWLVLALLSVSVVLISTAAALLIVPNLPTETPTPKRSECVTRW